MNNINSYVKDSTDFLKRIFRLNNNIPTNNNILVTIDVKSLYTNIPNEEGISASINLLKEHNASHNINLDVIHDTIGVRGGGARGAAAPPQTNGNVAKSGKFSTEVGQKIYEKILKWDENKEK